MSDGPFTDDMIKHAFTTVQTQHGIIEYAEAMAQVLAEAGRASNKATGDPVISAINQWSEIIRKRAIAIAGSLGSKDRTIKELHDEKDNR